MNKKIIAELIEENHVLIDKINDAMQDESDPIVKEFLLEISNEKMHHEEILADIKRGIIGTAAVESAKKALASIYPWLKFNYNDNTYKQPLISRPYKIWTLAEGLNGDFLHLKTPSLKKRAIAIISILKKSIAKKDDKEFMRRYCGY